MCSSVSQLILMKLLFPTMSCNSETDPAGLKFVILVHRNTQVTSLTIGYIQFRQDFGVLARGRRAYLRV